MAVIEERVRRRAKRMRLQQALILAAYRSTTYSTLAFAPKEYLLKQLDPEGIFKKSDPTRRMRQALKQLETKGVVKWAQNEDGRWRVTLTAVGKQRAQRLDEAEKILLKKPKKWDGRWRIVIFDIWESRKHVRDKLRGALIKAGFQKIQNSVWAYPYDCEDFLTFLRVDFKLGTGIIYIIAEGIENDAVLRQKFGL